MTPTSWAALADPTRRSVLELLRRSPHSVNELATGLHVTQPTASKHLRVLRDAGLVRVERDAQRRIYAIDMRPLAQLDDWLAPYRELWESRLDALGRHLDAVPAATAATTTTTTTGAAAATAAAAATTATRGRRRGTDIEEP